MTDAECDRAEPAPRPARRDVSRNRALLLDAARAVFAERGLQASMDDIAHRAGLGVGTVYRHFANKQEIAEALFAQGIEQVIADAERSLTIADPWQALVAFFETAAARQASDRGLHEVLVGTYSVEHLGRVRDQLTVPVTKLFDRAIRAGALRADVVANDSGVIFVMLGVVYDMGSAGSPQLWRRYLALLLDGLRATDTAVPLPVPPLTEAEFDTAIATVKYRGDKPPSRVAADGAS